MSAARHEEHCEDTEDIGSRFVYSKFGERGYKLLSPSDNSLLTWFMNTAVFLTVFVSFRDSMLHSKVENEKGMQLVCSGGVLPPPSFLTSPLTLFACHATW